MRPDLPILAFDTSAAHCAAALLLGGYVAEGRLEHLLRGQAERLMPLLAEILTAQNLGWRDLYAIGVGIGPGNFTGIRISVAAARGLGLALDIPVVGVSTFEIIRDPEDGLQDANEIVSLEGPRGSAYVQHFRHGNPQGAPRQIDPADPPEDLRLPTNMLVTGYMAEEIARPFNARSRPAAPADIGPRIARRAYWRLSFEKERPARPAPLYVRPPDAAPPRDAAPVILP